MRDQFTTSGYRKMSTAISAAKKIPRDFHTYPLPMEGTDQVDDTSVLYVTKRFKATERTVKAGADLFRFGDTGEAIYSLVDGWVALYNLLEDGRRQILQFALPGTILAFAPVRRAVMSYSALALTDAVVCVIPHEKLGRVSREYPEFGMQLAGLIAQDRCLAYDQLSSVGRRPARERVAHLLLELFIRSRMRWPGHRSEEMQLPLTQEHIGDATGLTGVHVNRVLRDLRKERILEFHYRKLRILDPDRLVDVAGIDPQTALSWIKVNPSDKVTDGPMAMRLDVSRRGQACVQSASRIRA